MKIIIFNPGTEGGIQRYACLQGKALQDLGCNVIIVCDEGHYIQEQEGIPVERALVLEPPRKRGQLKLIRMLHFVGRILRNEWRLARLVRRIRPDVVLLSSFTEYFSPVWSWMQLGCRGLFGVTYVANLHDPVRDFVVGPLWWHELSVRMAYWPLSAVYTHQRVPPVAKVPADILIREVPHGLFDAREPAGKQTEPQTDRWGFPAEAVVFLAFGFIRDGKNIDLLVRSLVSCPTAHLVVMGRVQSASNNRAASYYRELAQEIGVSDRVKIIDEFVPEEMLAGCFFAADAIAVTYSGAFHSQSGVLNTIAHANKPVLASSGESPLKDCVLRFDLGIFVPPDNLELLEDGMASMCRMIEHARQGFPPPADSPKLDWESYRRFASWETNARIVLDSLREIRGNSDQG
jgi:glycosyltransferase involved in cell wall biosynthesis